MEEVPCPATVALYAGVTDFSYLFKGGEGAAPPADGSFLRMEHFLVAPFLFLLHLPLPQS